MQKGTHLLIDCRGVDRDVCLDDKLFLNAMAEAATAAGATVVSQVRYRFGEESPPGFTAVVLLDESHCSAHSYADLGLVALDIFTCGRANPRDILATLCDRIPLGKITVQEVARFLVPDAAPPALAAAAAEE